MPNKHITTKNEQALTMPQIEEIKSKVLQGLPIESIIERHAQLMASNNEGVAIKGVEMGYKLYGAFEGEEKTVKTMIILNVPAPLAPDALRDIQVHDVIDAHISSSAV